VQDCFSALHGKRGITQDLLEITEDSRILNPNYSYVENIERLFA